MMTDEILTKSIINELITTAQSEKIEKQRPEMYNRTIAHLEMLLYCELDNDEKDMILQSIDLD